MDRLTPERRSWLMSRVRGRNTSTELRVRRVAHAMGFRYRLHRRDLPGTPDLVFPRRRVAMFVHGCFWHRHEGCRGATTPSSHVSFWRDKFARNVARDRQVTEDLRNLGWKVAVVWECETKNDDVLACLLECLLGGALDARGAAAGRGDGR